MWSPSGKGASCFTIAAAACRPTWRRIKSTATVADAGISRQSTRTPRINRPARSSSPSASASFASATTRYNSHGTPRTSWSGICRTSEYAFRRSVASPSRAAMRTRYCRAMLEIPTATACASIVLVNAVRAAAKSPSQ